MKKKLGITLTLMLLIGGFVIAGCVIDYIKNINSELVSANKKIVELESTNSGKQKEIDKLVGELEVSIKENIELKDTNSKLKKQVTSLEKELEEKVYPTQIAKTRTTTNNKTPISITMTFYGDFASENGGYEGIDASGNKLKLGTVASNYYPMGTQFEFNGQIFTVSDRGGSKLNSPNKLDVFVPRLKNESNSEYRKRLLQYGVRKVTMYKR